MKGEFIWIWSETWREIWLPLTSQEGISEDIYCELYRELEPALRRPVGEAAIELVIGDSLQLREAFDRALALAGINVDLARREAAYNAIPTASDSAQRRGASEGALATFTYDQEQARQLMSQAIGELVADETKRDEVWNRMIETTINDTAKCKDKLQNTQPSDLKGERALIQFFEAAFVVIEDLGGDTLSNSYFGLLAAFVEKFSLRYDLRRPCQFCPTLSGVFVGLVRELRTLTSGNTHFDALMKDFEGAVRDLRADSSEGKIKTCIQKQINLLEALGRACPGVTQTTLGRICDQVGSWPHVEVKDAMKNLYGFTNDYPGIRHGGTPTSALRAVDLRDLIAISILLAGFTPYLAHQIQADAVYRGA